MTWFSKKNLMVSTAASTLLLALVFLVVQADKSEIAARTLRHGGYSQTFGGETECDYRPVDCNVGGSQVDALACMNEGYHAAAVAKATSLATLVARHKPQENTDLNTVLSDSAKLLSQMWGYEAIWLSFTPSTGGQFALMNCTDVAKSDRPECAACGHCDLLLEAQDPTLYGDNEYRMYIVNRTGDLQSFDPIYQTQGNTFDPTQSDAYKKVQETMAGSWVPYWKPEEKLATFAYPILYF